MVWVFRRIGTIIHFPFSILFCNKMLIDQKWLREKISSLRKTSKVAASVITLKLFKMCLQIKIKKEMLDIL